MNVWLVGAGALMLGLVPLALAIRRSPLDGVIALQLAGTLVSLVFLLLAEGFERSSYLVLPVVAPLVSFVGTLVFLRLLAKLEGTESTT
jgi:multisubunit Na+/H+ antiporter MnhF subunit